MTPATHLANEKQVAEAIRKRLARDGNEGIQRGIRFNQLLLELQCNVHDSMFICFLLKRGSFQAENFGPSCIFCCA